MGIQDNQKTDMVLPKNSVAKIRTNVLIERGLDFAKAAETQDQTYVEKCFKFLEANGYFPKMSEPETDDDTKAKITTIYFDDINGKRCWVEFFGDSDLLFYIESKCIFEKTILDRRSALELIDDYNLRNIDTLVTYYAEGTDDILISFKSVCYIPCFFEQTFASKMSAIQQSARDFSQDVLDKNLPREEGYGSNREENLFKTKCLRYLTEKGYSPKLDGQCIDFMKDNQKIFIWVDAAETGVYFDINFFYRYRNSAIDRKTALELANQVNYTRICAKVSVMDDPNDGWTVFSFMSKCYHTDLFKHFDLSEHFWDIEQVINDKLNAIQTDINLFERLVSEINA